MVDGVATIEEGIVDRTKLKAIGTEFARSAADEKSLSGDQFALDRNQSAGIFLFGENHLGATVLDLMAKKLAFVGGVEWNMYRAQFRASEEQQDLLNRIVEYGGDAFAGADLHRGKAVG